MLHIGDALDAVKSKQKKLEGSKILSIYLTKITEIVDNRVHPIHCTFVCDKFVSDMLQVSGFLQVLRFPPPIKLTATIY